MLGISFGEIFLVCIMFIIFIPPKDIPNTINEVWKFLQKAREVAEDIKKPIEDTVKNIETDLDDNISVYIKEVDSIMEELNDVNKHDQKLQNGEDFEDK